ncbi:MAG TPA: galactokinase [Polyangiaceae bacterium]|nr:galactokinase [Polyangiaceae bacterium]
MTDIASLRKVFESTYGAKPRIFSAPGRVNLIGEHTDYNDGFVLPMAIDRRATVAAAARPDRKVRVRSHTLGKSEEFDLDRPGPKQRDSWLDYIEGTAQALEDRGIKLKGADLLIDSNVPTGAGLSSSAALEMSVGLALSTLAGATQLSRVDLALAGQAAEHAYVGTLCGIMDQFIAALGRSDHALLIDCRTLEPTPVPLALPGAVILICDTRVKHALASSKYNERRAECRSGTEILGRFLPGVRALRDVSVADFERFEKDLAMPVKRRCRHVVTENARTLAAARALADNDLAEFGRLMVASHRSLQQDYEVSCPELDLCVDVATTVPGVYGARMTGGGFGGCTVNLVREDAVAAASAALCSEMERRFDKKPEIFASRATGGAMEHTG